MYIFSYIYLYEIFLYFYISINFASCVCPDRWILGPFGHHLTPLGAFSTPRCVTNGSKIQLD